jgi:hypothetical protein
VDATTPVPHSRKVEWTDYWPENARVPRLDPTDGNWTFNVDGKQPDYEGRVEVVFKCGKRNAVHSSGSWAWELGDGAFHIVAWRPAK